MNAKPKDFCFVGDTTILVLNNPANLLKSVMIQSAKF